MDSRQVSEKQTRRRSRTVSWDHSVRADGDQPLVCRTTTADRGVLWPQVRRFDRKRYDVRQISHCHSLWPYSRPLQCAARIRSSFLPDGIVRCCHPFYFRLKHVGGRRLPDGYSYIVYCSPHNV